MTGVLIKEEKRQTQTEGRWPCDDRDIDWSYATVSKGTPRIAGSHQKLE